MATIADVIIESDRDEKTLVYLIQLLGQQAIVDTISNFKGGRRYYVSNIAKAHKIEIPAHVYSVIPDKAVVDEYLQNLKSLFGNS